MARHTVGTREEWLVARKELLEQEKALTRRSDELSLRRRELPWVRIDKEYIFETDLGPKIAQGSAGKNLSHNGELCQVARLAIDVGPDVNENHRTVFRCRHDRSQSRPVHG